MAKVKKLSRSKYILTLFVDPKTALSCQEVTKLVASQEKMTDTTKLQYLSGSVSSKLRKLVLLGVLKYADWTTDRGGHIYQKK